MKAAGSTGDLLATTARPAWARQAAALGATLFWLLLTFLAAAAVLYIQVALQATWGGPPLWPVVVGAVELVTVTVIGFAAGALFPGRFTAPFAAIGAFLLSFVGYHAALNPTPHLSTYALLSPATAVPLGDIGVFYHVAPDIAIAQVIFMGGITVALLGVLALAPVLRIRGGFFAAISRAGRPLCAVGVALLAIGVAASWTAFALAGTAKPGVSGWDIPVLHDAASDQPVPYTPDCAGTSFQVCVHPAFSAYLTTRQRHSSRWPRKSRGCRAPRSAPSRCRPTTGSGSRRVCAWPGYRGRACPGLRRCTATPATATSPHSGGARQRWTTSGARASSRTS